MIAMDEIESGLFVTHKATGLRYSVIDSEDDEVLLSPEQEGLQDLTVALALFQAEFIASDRFRGSAGGRRGGKSRGRRRPRGARGRRRAGSSPRLSARDERP